MKSYIQCVKMALLLTSSHLPTAAYAEVEHGFPCLRRHRRLLQVGRTTFVFDQALYDAIHIEPEPVVDLLAEADARILELEYELLLAQEGLIV
jgi:hypothetical protein